MVELDEGVLGPDGVLDLFASDDITGPFNQQRRRPEG